MEPGRAHRLCEYMRAQAPNASPGRADYLANVADDWERARTAEVTEKARADALEVELERLRTEVGTLKLRLSNSKLEHAVALAAKDARIAFAVAWLEDRFGNQNGNDWADEAAGRVADVLEGNAEP